jgi:uncharacterized SAM-binding protein YcdF (DUF218 family)
LKRLLDAFVRLAGWIFIFVMLSALLGLPWKVYGWLARDIGEFEGAPDIIVMMGGGGIPSESGLMRTWQTAREAARFPRARVLIAHPFEEGESDSNPNPIVKELVMRGVSETRILREGKGRHTREQADRVRELLDGMEDRVRLLIITSPEHMRRSLLSFKKAGFPHVRGRAVMPQPIEANLEYGSEPDTKKPSMESLVGHSLMLRYRIWDNLGLTVRVARELAALAYYRAKGWI